MLYSERQRTDWWFSVSIDTANRLVGSTGWVKQVKMVKRHKSLVIRKISSGDAMYSLVIKLTMLHCMPIRSDQIRSLTQSCPALCDPMNRSTPGLPVHHQLPEFTETHVHQVSDAFQPSHPLSSPSPLAPNPSQHQSLFQ